MVDIKYSQNFYKNNEILSELVKSANFSSEDIILDIGAGNGIITGELIKYTGKVIAYELDTALYDKLKKNFPSLSNTEIRNEDFLTTELPIENFKIFANIPFALTTDIINKITQTDSLLVEAYLFVQKESAERFIGVLKNTQISAILSSKFSLSIVEAFDRYDFEPIPNVDIVLLKISRKKNPEKEFYLYRDFITYIFNQTNSSVIKTFKKLFTFNQLKHIKKYLNRNKYTKPSEIPSGYYWEIFQYFKENGDKSKKRILNYYEKSLLQHSKREVIHRTRV
jgi:16S rRNA A1518/A1519 N6-dimethyltransferase RsmA/KsgA/DIM1 with predicted DNA glycosylase/AP lyase activity